MLSPEEVRSLSESRADLGWVELRADMQIPQQVLQGILSYRQRALAEWEQRNRRGTTIRAGAATLYAQVSSLVRGGSCGFPGCSEYTGIGFWTCPDHRDFEDQFDPESGMPIDDPFFGDPENEETNARQARYRIFAARILG